MRKPNLTIWHVPMDVIPEIMNVLEREVCTRVSLGQYEQAKDTLHCLGELKKDFVKEMEEYNRLLEPDPEEEGDEDE